MKINRRRHTEKCSFTSTTDKAGQNSFMVGLTLLIVLCKINLNCRDGPSRHDGNYFGIIPPPPGEETVIPINFAQKPLRIKLDSASSVPRSYNAQLWIGSFVRV